MFHNLDISKIYFRTIKLLIRFNEKTIYKSLLITLLILLPFFCKAQGVLSGIIVDKKSKELIAGATVFVPELRIGTSSDKKGMYTIPKIPKGSLTVQVRFLGYKTLTRKIIVEGALEMDFELEQSAIVGDEVIISGPSAATLTKESPLPIITYSKQQWLQSSSTNLVDAVGKLPGMSQITTGVGLSKPVIRGLGFNRVITMHDGVRQEDNQWGEEHSIHVDEYSIDRYEVIKGAGSLMYGSDGIGGVMSILSPYPAEEGTIKGQILTNYQSNNKMYGLSGMIEGNQKGVFWRARISHKNAGNYQNRYDGWVYGSNYKELDYNGILGLNRKWGYSHLYISKFNQEVNIVDGVRDSLGRFTKAVKIDEENQAIVPVTSEELRQRKINPGSRQLLTNYKVSLNNLFYLKNSSLSVILSYAQNHRQEFANILQPTIPDLYFFLQTSYYDIKYNFPEWKNWITTLGSNGMYQTMNNKGSQALYPNFDLIDNGIFIFSKRKLNNFHISGGVRMDRRSLSISKLFINEQGQFTTESQGAIEERFGGFSKEYKNLTGSLGMVYELTEQLSLKLNAARGFRAPSVPEISSNGEHAGTFRYEIGNPSQKSENSFQTDLGAVFENKSVYINVAIYQNSIKNYSYSEKVLNKAGEDSIVDPTNPILTYRYTQGNAMLYGGETSLTINPETAKWINFTSSYSIVRSINFSAKNDSAKYLPFLPAPRFVTQLKFTRDNIFKTFGKA